MKEETYDERLERMRNYNRAGAPPPGIRSAIGTVGGYQYLEAQRVKLAKQAQGAPKKKNIDTDFDDFSLAPSTGGGGSARSILPFSVALVNSATPTAAVSAHSRLYKSISTTDTQTITDLSTAFTLANNTHVWIQVTVSSLAITAASRQTGTAWPSLVVTSGSPAAQTQFNIPVGRVVASDPNKPGFEFSIAGTKYHFEQCLFSHLLVENRCNNGTPIIYGFPWGGAA